MTENYTVDGQMSIMDLDPDLWFGKTYPEHSAATKEKTSKRSSQKSSKSLNRNAPMCLCLKKESGPKPGAYTMNWGGGQLLGEYTMHSFGESPKEENASHLSQILEACAPRKYCLSARACQGILNRAEKRGKALPPILREALENQIADSLTEHSTSDDESG